MYRERGLDPLTESVLKSISSKKYKLDVGKKNGTEYKEGCTPKEDCNERHGLSNDWIYVDAIDITLLNRNNIIL